jgi:hypothetical protein
VIRLELTDAEARALVVNCEFVELVFADSRVERQEFPNGSPRQLAVAKLTSALEREGVEWESIRC